MSTTTDYGEPWTKKEHNWSDTSLYSHGGKTYLFTRSLSEDTNEDNQEEREKEQSALLDRIVSCVNSMQGIPDPEAALRKSRDEFTHLIAFIEPALEAGVSIPGLATMNGAKLALSLLTPSK